LKNEVNEKSGQARTKREPMFVQVIKRLFENPLAVFGGIVLLILILMAIGAPILTKFEPDQQDLFNINAKPSLEHIFGTDALGRDCYTRILYGARYSLSLGIVGALFGTICGAIIGTIAGFFGGQVENIIMRIMDIWSSIPSILLAIIISATLGSGFVNTMLALSIGSIPMGVRLIRAQILSERSKEYLEAAKSINCSSTRIMFKHLIPNVISPLIVETTMRIGRVICEAAALSYIGLGVQEPTAEWGAMLSSGRRFIGTVPHLILFPGIFIMITVMCINLLGDGLRDALDPKLKV
jgi:ABC-type dipeptide/oligopeptide/nickel transport system permease subunit